MRTLFLSFALALAGCGASNNNQAKVMDADEGSIKITINDADAMDLFSKLAVAAPSNGHTSVKAWASGDKTATVRCVKQPSFGLPDEHPNYCVVLLKKRSSASFSSDATKSVVTISKVEDARGLYASLAVQEQGSDQTAIKRWKGTQSEVYCVKQPSFGLSTDQPYFCTITQYH